MTVMAVLIGFLFGVIVSALFAEWVRYYENRSPKVPNCPNIPPPPDPPAPNQRPMSDYL